MTLIKSIFQQKEGGLTKSTCAKLIKKTKPFSMLGIIAQSSGLVCSSLHSLQNSFFHRLTSFATKKQSSAITYSSCDATGTKRESGPMELRGRELLHKFRAVVKAIEAPTNTSSGYVEALGTGALETKEQDTNLRCTSSKTRTEHIPPKLPFTASDLLNASKLKQPMASQAVPVTKIPSSERPAKFSISDLKSVQLKKTGVNRDARSSSSSSTDSSSAQIKSEAKIPDNNDKKRKFDIADILTVKLRPVNTARNGSNSRNSNGSNTTKLKLSALRAVKTPQQSKAPPMSMHSALKAALTKKFGQAISQKENDLNSESPLSQW